MLKKTKRVVSRLLICFWLGGPILLCAQEPDWWEQQWGGVDPIRNSSPAANNGIVVQGQLKHVANSTHAYLNGVLVDPATGQPPTAADWNDGFAGSSPLPFADTGNNYTVVVQGQAKYIADGIYSLLESRQWLVQGEAIPELHELIGKYNVQGVRWGWNRPWTDSSSDTAHLAPLLIGQLKFMFALDFDAPLNQVHPDDPDRDGIHAFDQPDGESFDSLNDGYNSNDPQYSDGDAWSNLVEYLSNPEGNWEGGFNSALSNSGVLEQALNRSGASGESLLLVLPGEGQAVFTVRESTMRIMGVGIY